MTKVGTNFFLDSTSGGTGPELHYNGAAVTAGEFGTWTPIGAVQVAGGGYDIAWHNTSSGLYTVWSTDSNGNYLSNPIGAVPGNNTALESLETSFHQDLNGDGTIGIPSATPTPTPPALAVNFTSLTESSSDIVTIQGTADAYSQVKLYDGTTSLGTATAAANGTWTFNTSSAVSDTLHTFTAQEVDNTATWLRRVRARRSSPQATPAL